VGRDHLLDGARAFVAVAERRHVGHAAEALGVARNTVSARLSAYERHVGRVLVDRSHRRVVALTAAGDALLPAARELLAAAAVHDRQALGVRTGLAGVVRVAVRSEPSGLVHHLLAAVREVSAAWRVDVQVRAPWEISRAFAYGEIEAALTPRCPADPNRDALDPRPRNFEAIDGFRIGTWQSGLYVSWRSGWTGEHADALIGTARAAASALRRAEVQRRREEQRRIVALQTADLLAKLARRRAEVLGAGSGRSEALSPGATGSRPGR
jgi:DNA-binding transcriptional LysR family regulator